MTKNIAWVTDSTASFSQEDDQWLKDNHVYVVPLYVTFGETSYKEGIDLSIDDFYKKMSLSNILPLSSQPTLGDFLELYESLKKRYSEVVLIHVSSFLSGTLSTSVQAAKMVNIKTYVVDSWIGSFPLKYLIKFAVELYNKGTRIEDIVNKLLHLRTKNKLMLLPANLNQLRKSGRVSNISSIVGSLLKVKPLLSFNEGKVSIIEKIRTTKKAEAVLLDYLTKSYEKGIEHSISLLYAGERENIDGIRYRIKERFTDLKVNITPLIPVAGVHIGSGTIGLSWIEK